MAKLMTVEGIVKKVKPKNGKHFTLKEMQEMVGGYIEIVPMPDGKTSIVVNEEGKADFGTCMPLTPRNEKAIEFWRKEYPIAQYPNNNDECICGNALIVTDSELEQ